MNITDRLAEALNAGENAETLFLRLTARGDIDCRASAVKHLCEAFQHSQDLRSSALAAYESTKGRDAEVEALVAAAEKVIEMNRQHAADQYGDADKAESWGCVVVLRESLIPFTGAKP